jgi:hypothetical protein
MSAITAVAAIAKKMPDRKSLRDRVASNSRPTALKVADNPNDPLQTMSLPWSEPLDGRFTRIVLRGIRSPTPSSDSVLVSFFGSQ